MVRFPYYPMCAIVVVGLLLLIEHTINSIIAVRIGEVTNDLFFSEQ
jgi:hypothetical protein